MKPKKSRKAKLKTKASGLRSERESITCVLDLTGDDIRAPKDSDVKLLIVGNNYLLKQASVTTTDTAGNATTNSFTDQIDPSEKEVTIHVLAGLNTVVMTFFPPPAMETLDITENCGGGTKQPILSFGAGIRSSAAFNIHC